MHIRAAISTWKDQTTKFKSFFRSRESKFEKFSVHALILVVAFAFAFVLAYFSFIIGAKNKPDWTEVYGHLPW